MNKITQETLVPIGVIAAIGSLLGITIWWASSITSKTDQLPEIKENLELIKQSVSSIQGKVDILTQTMGVVNRSTAINNN